MLGKWHMILEHWNVDAMHGHYKNWEWSLHSHSTYIHILKMKLIVSCKTNSDSYNSALHRITMFTTIYKTGFLYQSHVLISRFTQNDSDHRKAALNRTITKRLFKFFQTSWVYLVWVKSSFC